MEAEYQKSVWTMPYAIISLNIHTITVDIHTITFSGRCPGKSRKSKNAPVETAPPGHSTFCNRVKEAENSLDTREFLSKGGERKILTQL